MQTSATPRDANAGPLIGPVVITEIRYNPAAPALETSVGLNELSAAVTALR